MVWFFASDLHGHRSRYRSLLKAVAAERPSVLLLGGDLGSRQDPDFISTFLAQELRTLRQELGNAFPRILAILGNDDPRIQEKEMQALEAEGLLEYLHGAKVSVGPWQIYGYACVPPTPFQLKDWERYDVSRYVEPGCISPEEGFRTLPVAPNLIRYGTIAKDLQSLAGEASMAQAIWLFHTPPYQTKLDRAALDGVKVEGVPVDVHVGSQAVRRFIEARQPWITLHGHVHESPRLTGSWKDEVGSTLLFSAAHDGPELALVSFDPEKPEEAIRRLPS